MSGREDNSVDEDTKPSVLWATNMAAPYRRPVWAALGAETRLEVRVLHSDSQFEKAQRRGNRGSDWRLDAAGLGNATLAAAPTRMLRVRGRRWFCIRGSASALVGTARDAVVLGGWEQPAYWQILRAARSRKVRTVGFYESTLATSRHASGPVARARSRFFRQLDAVVVPGIAAASAVQAMGVEEGRVFVGFNAIDTSSFRRRASEARAPQQGHSFLYVGQLIDRKNLLALIEAFSTAREANDRLTLVGKGELAEALQAEVSRRGLDAQVSLLGPQPYEELPAIMHSHDTLVLPSKEEVWGLVVNEALTAGMHVVVTEVSGVAPSVADMRGVYVTGVTPTELDRAMYRSREEWTGPVENPEILEHTPQQLAAVFDQAIRGAQ